MAASLAMMAALEAVVFLLALRLEARRQGALDRGSHDFTLCWFDCQGKGSWFEVETEERAIARREASFGDERVFKKKREEGSSAGENARQDGWGRFYQGGVCRAERDLLGAIREVATTAAATDSSLFKGHLARL